MKGKPTLFFFIPYFVQSFPAINLADLDLSAYTDIAPSEQKKITTASRQRLYRNVTNARGVPSLRGIMIHWTRPGLKLQPLALIGVVMLQIEEPTIEAHTNEFLPEEYSTKEASMND